MTDRELLQQALDALISVWNMDKTTKQVESIQAIKARLTQPEPEAVADKYLMEVECTKCGAKQDGILTVTAPPKKEWVGLTDEEIWHLSQYNCGTRREFAKAIKTKLKEKNGMD